MNKKNSIAWPIAICADSDIADKIEVILHINLFLPNNNENSYIEIVGYWYPGKNTITLVETLT